jgi:hypothetical protein
MLQASVLVEVGGGGVRKAIYKNVTSLGGGVPRNTPRRMEHSAVAPLAPRDETLHSYCTSLQAKLCKFQWHSYFNNRMIAEMFWPRDRLSSLRISMIFLSCYRRISRLYAKLYHDRFLSDPFQFIIY